MRLAGQHGDGLITDPLSWKQHKSEWEAGARRSRQGHPNEMPVLIEQYVVVGDRGDAASRRRIVAIWPQGVQGLSRHPDPAAIEQHADGEIPIEKVLSSWAVGTDSAGHLKKVQELFDSGATIVNIHTGQADQKKVIDFYGANILPSFR